MPSKVMTKAQLVDKLASMMSTDKKTAAGFLDALVEHIHGTVKKGGEVKIAELGKFKLVQRKARMGRNPATGAAIKIPAKKLVKFTVARSLKDIAKK